MHVFAGKARQKVSDVGLLALVTSILVVVVLSVLDGGGEAPAVAISGGGLRLRGQNKSTLLVTSALGAAVSRIYTSHGTNLSGAPVGGQGASGSARRNGVRAAASSSV